MASFEPALQKTLINEGGYGNDPDDPGGETYKGIARKMNGTWDGWPIIDALRKQPGFPKSLEKNSDLQEKIKSFYKVNYWDKLMGEQITDQEVASVIFDYAVNVGIPHAVVGAQTAADVTADGVFGNGTLTAINEMNPEFFIAAFTVQKVIRYVHIATRNPALRKYFFGWISRAVNN